MSETALLAPSALLGGAFACQEPAMRRTLATLALTLGFILTATGLANADPITCPPGQVGTHNPSEGGWVCVNNGGNTNNSEDPRPPNADKGDFRH